MSSLLVEWSTSWKVPARTEPQAQPSHIHSHLLALTGGSVICHLLWKVLLETLGKVGAPFVTSSSIYHLPRAQNLLWPLLKAP